MQKVHRAEKKSRNVRKKREREKERESTANVFEPEVEDELTGPAKWSDSNQHPTEYRKRTVAPNGWSNANTKKTTRPNAKSVSLKCTIVRSNFYNAAPPVVKRNSLQKKL